jgi:hypothetical protein
MHLSRVSLLTGKSDECSWMFIGRARRIQTFRDPGPNLILNTHNETTSPDIIVVPER